MDLGPGDPRVGLPASSVPRPGSAFEIEWVRGGAVHLRSDTSLDTDVNPTPLPQESPATVDTDRNKTHRTPGPPGRVVTEGQRSPGYCR